MRKLAVIVCVLALASGGCGFGSSRGAREFGRRAPAIAGLKVIAFYDDSQERPRGNLLPLVAKYRSNISALTPLWYHVQSDGSVSGSPEADVTNFARREGIPLIPLVNNAGGNGAFLLSAAARNRAVRELVALIRRKGYQGIHIDFQLLKPRHKQGLNAFMRQLYGAVHRLRKLVAIDVIPIGRRSQPGNAYDFKTLSQNADEVVLMAYDAHDDSSGPGPIAPVDWVRRRIEVALGTGVLSSRLDLGIAAYGYDWPVNAAGTVIPGANIPTVAMKDVEAQGIKVQRDAEGEPHYSYTTQGQRHIVWYEDEVSVVRKIALARKYHLHELALWRVGYENDAYWRAVIRAAAPGGSS